MMFLLKFEISEDVSTCKYLCSCFDKKKRIIRSSVGCRECVLHFSWLMSSQPLMSSSPLISSRLLMSSCPLMSSHPPVNNSSRVFFRFSKMNHVETKHWHTVLCVPGRCSWQVFLAGVLDRCSWQVFLAGVSGRCFWQVFLAGVPDRYSWQTPCCLPPSHISLCLPCFQECPGKTDIAFLLDGSGSVASRDFAKMKVFVKDLIGMLVGKDTKVRLCSSALL